MNKESLKEKSQIENLQITVVKKICIHYIMLSKSKNIILNYRVWIYKN